jgi:hypothetical protein
VIRKKVEGGYEIAGSQRNRLAQEVGERKKIFGVSHVTLSPGRRPK